MLVKISKTLNVSADNLLSLDNRRYIEVSGLSEEVIAHVQQIISDLLNK